MSSESGNVAVLRPPLSEEQRRRAADHYAEHGTFPAWAGPVAVAKQPRRKTTPLTTRARAALVEAADEIDSLLALMTADMADGSDDYRKAWRGIALRIETLNRGILIAMQHPTEFNIEDFERDLYGRQGRVVRRS